MYDTIIIGSGPAGMTAGIFAARREMKTLVVGKEVGGQLVWASEIENYPGFSSVTSLELIQRMKEQVEKSGAEMKYDEIKEIKRNEDGSFSLFTNRETYQAKTVIIAMGLSPRRLEVPGEVEFNGKGVSYCANCDGPFYKGKKVAVIGGGNSALDAAEVMSKIASQVFLIHRRESFKAFEDLIREVENRDNINIRFNSEIKGIEGNGKVEKIRIFDHVSKKEEEIEVAGVFVEVGRIASTDLVADFVDRDERSQILVNEKTETRTPGIYAAGDVTNCEFKQITVAMGQGTNAALSAYQYLQTKNQPKA